MKKRFFAITMCAALAVTLLAGCGKTDNSSDIQEPDDAGTKAEQAYMDFLNGETKVTTSEKFREDDGEFNYDGLAYGTYTYEQMKAAIAEAEGHESVTKYALLDFGQDGIQELVLRFESTDASFTNWTGIIRYNGESLDLNAYYQDGYRTFSKLFTSGYLQIGGANSAGENQSSVVEFDEKGFAAELFTEKNYYGVFACSMVYDLTEDGSGLEESDFDYIAGQSQFLVREYMAGGKVKISAGQWNEDPTVRAGEEALVEALVALGAEQITEEEMDQLCSLEPYGSEEAAWTEWKDKNAEPVITIDYADEALLEQPEKYDEFVADESEAQVKAVFTADTTVKNFCVLALTVEEEGENGEFIYSTETLYSQEELTPKKPLVVVTSFAEIIPNMGISYVDDKGREHLYAMVMSGRDGSLLLEKIER